ncbi:site-specific integrase [Coraliomargarita sp. SDUM461004]|uniref:Site-specific integrase n=1 Tax=Thalassobacterium sedimentorum TaxID=3041258 RepID=A0ABU1ANQ8_9BACT|nr:site-specific integrase [Coraliomargarita sp. SDUM461004]MDQ8196425.1 site-specific integrase [Coraliomargarita sp. SDUM461004]
MSAVNFPNWRSCLRSDVDLSEQERASFEITIRWFLSYCKSMKAGADFERAWGFIDFAREQKQASEWTIERWKEAIRWFFRQGKARAGARAKGAMPAKTTPASAALGAGVVSGHGQSEASGAKSAQQGLGDLNLQTSKIRRGPRGPAMQAARLKASEPEWRLQCVRGIRIRDFSYSTEKAYLHWLRRFATYWKTDALESLGENEIKLYLDHLAVKERVSGGTQRLALPQTLQTRF